MALVSVTCPSCGKVHDFQGLDAAVPFRAECEKCSADLHVCLTCRFYDKYVENECRETEADPVSVKDRRNLCEYWKPRDGAAVDDDAARAKAKLDALFGKKPAAAAPTTTSADPGNAQAPASPADEARRKLDALFKKK